MGSWEEHLKAPDFCPLKLTKYDASVQVLGTKTSIERKAPCLSAESQIKATRTATLIHQKRSMTARLMISAPERLRKEESLEFEARLDSIVSSRPALGHRVRPCLKDKQVKPPPTEIVI